MRTFHDVAIIFFLNLQKNRSFTWAGMCFEVICSVLFSYVWSSLINLLPHSLLITSSTTLYMTSVLSIYQSFNISYTLKNIQNQFHLKFMSYLQKMKVFIIIIIIIISYVFVLKIKRVFFEFNNTNKAKSMGRRTFSHNQG